MRSEFGVPKENMPAEYRLGLTRSSKPSENRAAVRRITERNTKRHGVDLATDAEMQTMSGGYFLRG